MPFSYKQRWRRATAIYWLMLIYILAALLWWFISLTRQNKQMTAFKTEQLNATVDQRINPALHARVEEIIRADERRNLGKYIGEGATFLILILIGAGYVYRSVRRQFRVQQQQQNFMMAVTHELKTPISVARLNLETLQRHQLEPERQQRFINNSLEEISRLNELTNNILLSAQMESENYRLDKEEVDFSRLIRDMADSFQKRHAGRTFSNSIEPEIEYRGDPLLLQLLVSNLLENAAKYSEKDRAIELKLSKSGRQIKLEVIDQGPGIPDAEKKLIFRKFYRVGSEATRKTQGTGLGLYLCKRIAAYHQADISVKDNLPSGSNFTVAFAEP